ncbi:Stress response protein nst1 [Coemansia sp. RSA 1843]|nr:Stress response protein nst1 [Coemansia sp. RSA 1843]
MSSTEESAKAAVFGPELPPSMAREKATDFAADAPRELQLEPPGAAAERSSLSIFMNGAPRDGMYKSDYMSRTEVDLQRLFYTRLVSIMASHGFQENSFTEEDVVSVMLARGLMKSPSDDPVLALASELNDEMTEIVYTNMKQVVSSAIESGRMSKGSAEHAAADSQADAEADVLAHSGDIANDHSECEGIMKLMQSHSLHDSARSIATMSLEASISMNNSQPPAQLAQEPVAARNTDNPTSDEAAASKKKKKKGKKKGKPNANAVSRVGADDDTPRVQKDEGEAGGTAGAAKAPRNTLSSAQMAFPEPQASASFLELQKSRSRTSELRCSVALSKCRDTIMTWDLAGRSATAPGLSSGASRNSRHRDASGLWSNAYLDEQKGVRKFWLSLHDTERHSLLLLEKHVVTSRIQNHQNFSCPCNVCTRKREAIEFELMSLYEAYYKDVQRNTLRERLREFALDVDEGGENEPRLTFFDVFEKTTEEFIKRYASDPKEQEKAEGYRKLMTHFNSWRGSMETSTSSQQGLPTPSISKRDAKRRVDEDSIDRMFKPDFDEILDWFVDQGIENIKNRNIDVVKLSEKVGEVMASCVKRMYMFKSQLGDVPFDPDAFAGPSDGIGHGSSGGSRTGSGNDSRHHNNNDIFYTEGMLETADYFPADSKKFFDMMERLAEYHMREEDNFFLEEGVYDQGIDDEDLYKHVSSSIHRDSTSQRAAQLQQGLCPDCHGEIRDHDDRQLYSEPEERSASGYNSRKRARSQSMAGKSKPASHWDDGYADSDGSNVDGDSDGEGDGDDADDDDDDDNYADVSDSDGDNCCDVTDPDMHLGDTDDELDESDPEVAESEAEDARKAFQLFAARLFEQRVIEAYREKVVKDRQRNLIEELEAEEKRSHAKDKRKQKRKQREKERKRQIQQQKEEEKLAREAQARAEKERKREAEMQQLKEQERKKQEDAAKVRKVIEERNRRVLEEADRRLEKERRAKLQQEQERRAKLQQEQEKLDKEERKARERARRVLEADSKKEAAEALEQKQQEPSETPPTDTLPNPSSHLTRSAASPAKALAATLPVVLSDTNPPKSVDQAQLFHHTSVIPPSQSVSSSTSVPALLPASPSIAGIANVGGSSLLGPSDYSAAENRIPLIDSFQHISTYTPRSSLSAQRPSLPTSINPFDLPSVSPTAHSISPQRARSNSGNNFMQAPSGASVPVSMSGPAPAVVSFELDAEISSIVGRVMGSSTLQDDLIDGVEWRTKPTTAGLVENPCTAPSLNDRSAAMAKTGGAPPPLLDMSIRRNSAPSNKANSASAVFSGSEAPSNGWRELPVTMDKATEDVYLAYCALEKFRCDKTQSSGKSSNTNFGGFHSIVELSQMHGKISDRGIWRICVKFGQANPSVCRLNHADRLVAFALDTSAKSTALWPPQQQQQPALTEDMLNAFSLHPCSPLLNPQQTQTSTSTTTPVQNGMPPPALTVASLVASSQPLMQPFSQQQQQQHHQSGLAYSPVAQQSPTSLAFNQMSAQTGVGVYSAAMPPYSLPPFQSSPLNSAGFGQYPSSTNESPIATATRPPLQPPPLFSAHSPAAGLAAAKHMSAVSSEMWSAGIPGDSRLSQPQHHFHNQHQQRQQQQQQPSLVASFHALNMAPQQQAPRIFEQHPQQRQQQLQQMLRSVIQRQTGLVAPLRASLARSRFYATDKFQERETASENKFIHEREAAKLKALKEQLDKAQKQVDEIEAKINQRRNETEESKDN